MRYIKTTVLGGLVFLIPVGFVGFLLVQVFGIMQKIAEPIGNFLPLNDIGDIAIANLIAIVLMVLLCFTAGLIARHSPLAGRIETLDRRLSEIVPGYDMARSVLAGATDDDRLEARWKPVLAGDPAGIQRIGLEIERTAQDRVIVFLPGTPGSHSGIVQIYPAAQVRPLKLPPHQLMAVQQNYCKGLAAILDEPPGSKAE
jgi:uncharacterized membrane protein